MDTRAIVQAFDEIADHRDWRRLQTPRNLATAVALEAAELQELFQWRSDEQDIDAGLRRRIGEEAADVLMYLLVLCERQGIDLDAALAAKMAHNRRRFLQSDTPDEPA